MNYGYVVLEDIFKWFEGIFKGIEDIVKWYEDIKSHLKISLKI